MATLCCMQSVLQVFSPNLEVEMPKYKHSVLECNNKVTRHVAMHTLDSSLEQKLLFSRGSICKLIQDCTKRKCLPMGRQIYSIVFIHGFDSDSFIMDHIIRMFTACGSLVDASEAFYQVLNPSIFTWNALISAHLNLGDYEQTLLLFCKMQEKDELVPDKVSYLSAIKYCIFVGCVKNSRVLHREIIRAGVFVDVVMGSSIIDMYCKCGSVVDARKVFDDLSDRNEVSWNVIIAGYVEHGDLNLALELFYEMQEKGMSTTKVSLLSVLRGCGTMENFGQGLLVHGLLIESGLESDVVVGSSVMDMYAKCGELEEAQNIFDGLPNQDIVSYCIMTTGYARHGQGHLALDLFTKMIRLGMKPDKATMSSMLKACGCVGAIVEGRHVHDLILRGGFELDLIVGSSMIDMYAKLGSMDEAYKVFNTLPKKNVVSWGAILTGYVQHGDVGMALWLLSRMHQEGLKPSKPMLLCIVSSCSSMESIEHGRQVHAHIAESEFSLDMAVVSALVDMYAKCGSLEDAYRLFEGLQSHDSVSWGAMILGYAHHDKVHSVFYLFNKMLQDGIEPSAVTFSSVLKACGNKNAIKALRLVHCHIIQNGCEQNMITGSTLIDTYIKCEEVEDACHVFESLTNRDVVSWGAMITGYALHGHDVNAFELFRRMQQEGIEPNGSTILYILKSCGATGSIEQGRLVHHQFSSTGLPMDVVVGSTLVEMYANCGSLDEARNIFDYMPNKNIVSWGALIAGYALYGNLDQVQCCLDEMQQHGAKPVDAMFTSILAACSHSGQLNKGCEHFRAMLETYDIMPKAEHFNCMVDIFARRGQLNEAEDLLQTMPTPPDPIVWTSLLNSSKVYGSVSLGRHCFSEVFPMDLDDASSYTLMSDIYFASGMHEDIGLVATAEK